MENRNEPKTDTLLKEDSILISNTTNELNAINLLLSSSTSLVSASNNQIDRLSELNRTLSQQTITQNRQLDIFSDYIWYEKGKNTAALLANSNSIDALISGITNLGITRSFPAYHSVFDSLDTWDSTKRNIVLNNILVLIDEELKNPILLDSLTLYDNAFAAKANIERYLHMSFIKTKDTLAYILDAHAGTGYISLKAARDVLDDEFNGLANQLSAFSVRVFFYAYHRYDEYKIEAREKNLTKGH